MSISSFSSVRLRQILPANGPFTCPCCKHEGKHFFNLSVHFLTKHNLLDSWIKKAMEKMEEEAIAKAEENEAKGLLPDGSKDLKRQNEFVSSGEETDSNVRSFFKSHTGTLFCLLSVAVG